MEANELRIGNCIYFHKDDTGSSISGAITPIDLVDIVLNKNHAADNAEPILLTSEILLKAGFDALSPNLYRKYLTQDEILWDGSEITLRNHNQRFELNVKCVYVHQLQNIVFALTADELEINL